MPKVTNEALSGQALKVAGTRVEFDAAGVAQVSAEAAAVLAQLEGYTVEAEAAKAEAPKAAEPAVEKKPAKKPSDKKASAQDKE